MKLDTSDHYRIRLGKVVDYITTHLDRDLDVNTLADIAVMSPYHFHRIYRQLAGETVNASVRRLRLQHGAALLIRTDTSLKRIATQTAYSSVEAFTRAFSQQFGQTPGQYRQQKQAQINTVENFVSMLQPCKEKMIMYPVDIIENPALQLIGIEHKGDYLNIGQAFEKLFHFAATRQLLNQDTRSVAIYYQDPESVDEQVLRSHACINVVDTNVINGEADISLLEIPAGTCASLLFKGSYAELDNAYKYLFGEWLPNSGKEAADFPPFEEYLNDPKTTPANELLTRVNCLLK